MFMVHVHDKHRKEKRRSNKICEELELEGKGKGKTNGQSAHVCSQDFERVIQKAGVLIFILTRNFLDKRKKKKMKMIGRGERPDG